MTDTASHQPTAPSQPENRQHKSVDAYTRRMFWLKVVLPIGAVALIALLILWPYLKPAEILPDDLEVQKTELTQNGLSMSEPRFSGTTERQEPFMITAKTAAQSANDPAMMELIAIHATLDLERLGPLKLDASGGTYHTVTRRLNLIGPIEVKAGDQIKLSMGDIKADLKAGAGQSTQPLTIDANAAIMKAGALRVFDAGDRLRFERGVHITYFPDRALPILGPQFTSDDADQTATEIDMIETETN